MGMESHLYISFCIRIIRGILGLIYRQLPKKSEVLAKRKIPKIRAVYAMVLSPISANRADSISRAIKKKLAQIL